MMRRTFLPIVPLWAAALFGLSASALIGSLAVALASTAMQAEPPGDPDDPRLSDNPFFATSAYVRGDTFDEEPSVIAFNDSPNNSGHYSLATTEEVGAVWGMAYDSASDVLYAATYHKRNSKYGPMGPGGIYAIGVNAGGVRPFVTVPSSGSQRHDIEDDYQPDETSRRYVGRTSLGDIDMNADGTELYVTNLNTRRIDRFSLPDGEILGSFDVGGRDSFWARNARPFGLKFADGWLYHGVVNSALKSQDASYLWADVYASRPTGVAMRRVLRVQLDYDRGRHGRWQPWPEDDDLGWRRATYPHPMLTDIEFDDAGNMILGIRDRYIDTGPSLTEVFRRAPGDILLANKTDTMRWEVDLSAGEHYAGDNLVPGPEQEGERPYDELAIGGLSRVIARDVVVSTAINTFRNLGDGAIWFDNQTGDDTAREELVYNRLRHSGPMGKAQGLGDLEIISYTPPTATPTSTSTDTETPVGTPTSLVTPTPSVTPTPTPGYYEIYIPAGEKGDKCIPDAFHSDVVLVLDRSTSMLRPVEDGGIPKNQAAIDAAKQFVSLLDFTPDTLNRHDQVAIVGFNDTAWVQQDLGSSHEAAYGSLDQLSTMTQEGTRLDLAFLRGQEPLDGPNRKPENRPVMVLLTDGLPNRVPTPAPVGPQEQTVVEAAQLAKNKGTRIYTIGLGKPTDINPRMLIMAASERWMYYYMYYYAPRPEDLSGIYSQIAQTFDDCEPVNIDRATPCIPEEIFTDVVLVLDMSTSMYRETRTGRTKHGLAVEAAALFAEQLQLEPDGWGRQDQVAVVGFNDTAWTEVPLTADLEAVHKGLGELLAKIEEGTRLDLAFDEGQRAVEGAGHYPENQMVMVFLTDGLPNRVPTPVPEGPQEQTVLEAATRAKEQGTRIFTVGLGLPDDVLRRLLEMAASTPDDYYFAPDGEDLSDIYRQIAGRIVECP
jgi:Mg-chelatase subunit ChlD